MAQLILAHDATFLSRVSSARSARQSCAMQKVDSPRLRVVSAQSRRARSQVVRPHKMQRRLFNSRMPFRYDVFPIARFTRAKYSLQSVARSASALFERPKTSDASSFLKKRPSHERCCSCRAFHPRKVFASRNGAKRGVSRNCARKFPALLPADKTSRG